MDGFSIAFVMYGVAGILLLFRLLKGPTFADRAIVSDTLTNVVTLFLVAYAIHVRDAMYLDVALIFAMMSFVGIITIAKYGVKHS